MIKFCLAGITLMACLFINQTRAALHLPPGPITAHVTGGDDSFFDFALSNVPAGYDVGNNVYLAWCDDLFSTNDPTVNGGVHQGILISSLTPQAMPGRYAGLAWDKINYLINHKQGTATDIQLAIWHFTDGFIPDPAVNPLSVVMIAEAHAQGSGFVPGADQVTAAHMFWQGADASVQQCFIEVPPSGPECADRFTAGGFIYRNGKKVTFGIQGGYQNGRLWGGINFVDHGLKMHVQSRTITSYTVLDANCRRATYDVTINGRPGTATVRACDYGEPGRNDVMEITLSNEYTAGIGTTLGGDGPGGGNVQLHKPRCGRAAPPAHRGNGRR